VRKPALGCAFAVLLLAVPGTAPCLAQVAGDSATGTGQWMGFFFDIDARSGPSGENPTGHVALTFTDGQPYLSGSVTCLTVHDNVATMNFIEDDSPFFVGVVTVQVTDNGPSGSSDQLGGGLGVRSASDCTPLTDVATSEPGLLAGDIVVVDAQPFPTSKEQCKNGGWRDFPGFKNEGDCVSFVVAGGKNAVAAPPL
jgi:hypothetical protein